MLMKAAVFFKPNGIDKEIEQNLLKKLDELEFEYECASSDDANADEIAALCDIVLALGGDGTIIHAAKSAAKSGKRTLGINCGHLGYTAGLETDELEMLGALKTGEYTIDRRMMLKVKTDSGEFLGINEAVITKGALSRMLSIRAKVGSSSMDYSSDGLIIATPTGSTAYSLSAGGAVIDPTLDALAITPICTHSFFRSPIVVGAEQPIEVTVCCNREAYLTVDGDEAIPIKQNERVIISKADICVELIRIKTDGFLKTLIDKIK